MSNKIVVKCFYNGEVRAVGTIKSSTTLKSLKKRVRKEFHRDLDLKYKDSDGDIIALKKPSHLRDAIKVLLDNGEKMLRLTLADKPDSISQTEEEILDAMCQAVVVIDKKCKIILFNKSAERIFGYSRKELLGSNVNVLMPRSDAADHDEYVKRYLRTGEARLIGKGRQVVAQRKDGTSFAITLCLSENKAPNHHTFCGTLQEVVSNDNSQSSNKTSNPYVLLENILDTAIVINEKGAIQYFNKRAETFFGYNRSETLGRNVKMLMPSPFADEHDTYLTNYLSTGEAKVIGTGRDVIAQLKDGSIVPVNLSITEANRGGNRIFTGILREIKEEQIAEKSILQQEREVLDNLVVPAVVIDDKGTIHAFNKPSQELFGYTLIEVVGKNVSMLMPEPDSSRHNGYLSNYAQTGKKRVIGVGRDVVGRHKDGRTLPVHLSVTERKEGDRKIFTGIIQKLGK